MKIMSFINEKNNLLPVEVELTLLPGLPVIHFLGLADQNIKESVLRIKSAIRQQGFEYPKAQQIIVNLRPNHLKKSSKGLELAVIMAYLWETQQVPVFLPNKDFFVYGDVTLSGQVYEPDDLPYAVKSANWTILTGQSTFASFASNKPFRRMVLSEIKDIHNPDIIESSQASLKIQRPILSDLRLPDDLARLLEVVAVGEHPVLLAGPAGSGKSTVARIIHQLLPTPKETEWAELCEIHHSFQGAHSQTGCHHFSQSADFSQPLLFRPLVKPHHTTPLMSMIGGGLVPMAGEISRAHGGVLLLDEFLEFHPKVQEALREPFEEGIIRVARQGVVKSFPADALIVATTNLCPCGDFVPGQRGAFNCRFSRTRCQAYGQRLSGPLLDRFQILYFTKKLEDLRRPVQDVYDRIEEVRQHQLSIKSDGKKSKVLTLKELEPRMSLFCKKYLARPEGSERRRLSTLRVAKTLADLDFSAEIKPQHIGEAEEWTIKTFDKIKRWDL